MSIDSENSGCPAEAPAPSSKRRLFTLDHANHALVLVRRIVGDIVRDYAWLLEFAEALEAAGSNDNSPYIRRTREALYRKAVQLRLYLMELEEVGVELKDWALGIVDFPSIASGREICLCWRFGQKKISTWHKADEDPAIQRSLEALPAEDVSLASPL